MFAHAHCKYLSKPCFNERSLKTDGSLHRFCVFHRKKANDAQRRWHARRRRSRRTTNIDNNASTGSSDDSDAMPTKCYRTEVSSLQASHWYPTCVQGNGGDGITSLVLAENPWIVPVASDPRVPFIDGGNIAFTFGNDLTRLEEFVMELDDIVIDDVRYHGTPEAFLTGRYQESYPLYW